MLLKSSNFGAFFITFIDHKKRDEFKLLGKIGVVYQC
jgi:hypothetical protein